MITVSTPKGTRDFLPSDVYKRDYIFSTIRTVFQKYGYQPVETPAMENLSTLLGKYGEEGDKLLFKILNSGNFLKDVPPIDLENIPAKDLSAMICEKGLRYDLTVPFARYVVQHRNEITFPFKRYQIQPVWRADRPQKGRYREFFQCDVDVIGSKSLLNELELLLIIRDVFEQFDIPVLIKINHRKILMGICERFGITDQFNDFVVELDKLEKTGMEAVRNGLKEKGIGINLDELFPSNLHSLHAEEVVYHFKNFLGENNKEGMQGIQDIEKLFHYLKMVNFDPAMIRLDATLARGLNYYTGCIFEVVSKEVSMGSICGGGRYDDLAGIFGMPDVSGVGVSFGADRIFDVLSQSEKFPKDSIPSVKLLILNFGESEALNCLDVLGTIRNNGISAELYPEPVKIAKQLTYANNKKIPFVLLAGSKEMESGNFQLKDMMSGEQQTLDIVGIIQILK